MEQSETMQNDPTSSVFSFSVVCLFSSSDKHYTYEETFELFWLNHIREKEDCRD